MTSPNVQFRAANAASVEAYASLNGADARAHDIQLTMVR